MKSSGQEGTLMAVGLMARALTLVQQPFEAHARRRPQATAVIVGERRLSYAEIDLRAELVAAALRRHGAGPGRLIGLCLPRSEWLVAGLFGILKTGAGYVPLDPQYPAQRLALIARDAGLTLVVCDAATAPLAGGSGATPVVVTGLGPAELDAGDRPGGRAGSEQDVRHRSSAASNPDGIAYVLYTSGSTGAPKGVPLTHRNAMQFLAWTTRAFGPEEVAGSLASSSISFDFSIVDLVTPLLSGGTVILADSVLALPDLPARDEVRMICGTPSALAVLLDRPLPPGVRTLVSGGELLTASLCARVWANPGVRRLVNLYGPTEATTACLAHEVDRDETGDPPLGHPIAGAHLSVRDGRGAVVADAAVGELWIAGPAVAAGYLGRPDLTAQRFIADPAAPGGLHYRTGDLVRRTGTGYRFAGRADDQVKVRGFRVEPAEVQAVLAEHPLVRAAIVLAPVDAYGTRTLVGYVEPVAPVTAAELTQYLGQRLPPFMVPARVAILDALPVGPTGKVDRTALATLDAPGRRPAGSTAERPDDLELPADETETRLAAIVADATGTPRVGRHDRFAALGGHSLAAARVVARVAEELGVAVPLAAFLAEPTVAGLAAAVRAGAGTEPAGPHPAAPDPAGPHPAAPGHTGEESAAAGTVPARPLPMRHEGRDHYPLTDLQRQFWMLRQLSGTPWVTTVGFRLAVDGLPAEPTDAARRLSAALSAIVARHEVLRTRVEERDSHPTAVVVAPSPVAVCLTTPGSDPPLTQPFPNDGTPPLRAWLSPGPGSGRTEVTVAIDHAAFDGVSMGILVSELAIALAGGDPTAGGGRAGEVAALPLQVGDVALAAVIARSSAAAAVQRFWRSTLQGCAPPYDLPGRPRTGPLRHAGARVVRPVEPELVAAVDRFAIGRGLTPYTGWAAALAIELDALTGRPDTLFGVTAADRDWPGLDRLIGPLLDVLPVRVDCSDDPSFGLLASRVATATRLALAHRDVAADDLARYAGVTRPPGGSLTPVVLSVQPADVPVEVHIGPVRVELVGELDTNAAQNELTIYLNTTSAGVELHVEYDTDRFDRTDAEAFADRLLRLIRIGVVDADRPVSGFPLVDDAERTWLLAAGEGGPVPGGGPATVVDAILTHTRDRPETTAVVGADRELTYRETVGHASRVAAALAALAAPGRGPDELVGVCLPRDHLLPARLLGVWLAGAGYVPLEPDLPAARLRDLVAIAGLSLALATPATAPALAQVPGLAVLDVAALAGHAGDQPGPAGPLDPLDPAVPLGPTGRSDPATDPESLAYVLFTSGSTGRPKGVEITHANLAGYLAAMRAAPGFGPADAFLAVAPLGFDLSCFELWVALAVGARTIIVDRGTAADGPALARRVTEAGVTAMLVTPATLRLLVAAGLGRRPELTVIAAGEVLDAALAGDVLAVAGRLYNGYGPTEATVTVTCHAVPPGTTDPVPIGGPTPGDRLYVLDRAGRLTPPGIAGELWIGGAGVARGYRNQPELTGRAFTADPYHPGGRRYRTGDHVRWRPDGVLDYLGRRDAQVKVRGYRIELTEIEAALHADPAVAEAAVAVAHPGTPDARLVGYLVSRPDRELSAAAVAQRLRSRLPDYLVPTAWVQLAALPRTGSGKVDRRSLPAPGATRSSGRAPETELEKFLAEVWMEVLGRAGVSADDDFFALGGHSLAATRVATRLREALGAEVPVRVLFDRPRLADYAAEVERIVLAQLSELAAHPSHGAERPSQLTGMAGER